MAIERKRRLQLLLTSFTIGLGLLSRTSFIPAFIYPYLGDTLYALMIYWIIGFISPRASILSIALACTAICTLIEISQLYQAPWINNIRNTRIGGLILGFGFLWSDLVSYVAGALLGFGIESSNLTKLKK